MGAEMAAAMEMAVATEMGKAEIMENLPLPDPALREQALDDAVAQLETAFGRPLTDAQVDRVNALLDARQ
jgi:hypothetical protein